MSGGCDNVIFFSQPTIANGGNGATSADNQGLGLSPTMLTIERGTSVSLAALATAMLANPATLAEFVTALKGQLVEDAFGIAQGYLLKL
jgi:hypothetical protein